MSENSRASVNTAPGSEGVVSANNGSKPKANNAPKGTDSALKDLEAAVVTLQGAVNSKECSEIKSTIVDVLLPPAEAVQKMINDGELKNSATDGTKGKLGSAIRDIKAKCIKAKTASNTSSAATNVGKPSTNVSAKLSGNVSRTLNAKSTSTSTTDEERKKKASSEAYPKVGKEFEYGYLPFTKLDLLVPLYKEYLEKKQGSQTFGQYLETAYKPLKGGKRMRGRKTMRGGLGFPTRKALTNEQIVTQLWNQAMTFGKSSYIKRLKLPIPSVAQYIDDRYTPKLEARKITVNTPSPKEEPSGPPPLPGPPTTPPPPLPNAPAPLEVKPVTVGSRWSINLTANDVNTKNIDINKRYSAEVQVTDIKGSLITYKILTVKQQPPQGQGLPTLKKEGDVDTFSSMRWNELQKYGKIKLLEEAIADEPEEEAANKKNNQQGEFNNLNTTLFNGEGKEKGEFNSLNTSLFQGKESEETNKPNTQPFKKLNTSLFQGGNRRTRKHKHKRKVSKRKTRSRRVR